MAQNLPKGLDMPTNLKILSVGSNRISSLGDFLSWLINIRPLCISNNKISHLEGFGALTHLEELYADSKC